MKRSNCSFYLSGLILGYLSLHVLCGTVYKTVLREGSGPTPVVNQTVIVHYTGTLQTGEKFDSSHDRNEPFKFKLGVGEVIRGWDAGVISMRVGERARLEIAHEDAYGVEGLPPVIPPSAKLIFDIELLGIDGVAPLVQPPQNTPVVQTRGQFQQGSQQTSQGFQNGQSFPPPGQDFSSGMTQPFNSGASQSQMFTPPEPPVNNQVQQFRGSTLRQDQVFPPTQQQQPQPFGGSQGQTFAANPPQGQTLGPPNQGFQTNQVQPFGANQGQIFNAQSPAMSNQGMTNQPIGPGMNSGFQNQPMQPVSTQMQTGFSNPGRSFQAPSQDISRMNPMLTQGGQDFNNFQGFPSTGNQNQQSAGVPPPRPGSFGPQQFSGQRGIQGTAQQRTPPQQTNAFRPQPDLNNFPTRRFDQQDMQISRPIGRTTRNQVPDLNAIARQSVDLRPRQDSFGTSRDRGMPQGVEFSGARSSRLDRPTNELSDRRMLDRTDPGRSRGEVGLDPSFPEIFPGRDFRTGSRNMGGNVPNFFGARNRFSRDSRTREPSFNRFPGFNSRSFRGMDTQSGFQRDRMMFGRARLNRMRRGF